MMSDRVERITPTYRGVMIASTPGVVWWGRLRVTGLELLPLEGPLLLVGDHDSYWVGHRRGRDRGAGPEAD